eukprot:scaffold4576_cov95-Isochrysis_galbana.AAC.1
MPVTALASAVGTLGASGRELLRRQPSICSICLCAHRLQPLGSVTLHGSAAAPVPRAPPMPPPVVASVATYPAESQ